MRREKVLVLNLLAIVARWFDRDTVIELGCMTFEARSWI